MKRQAYAIAAVLLVMWGIRLADAMIPLDFNQFGLLPRTLRGLLGIVTMPFLHGGFGHLMSNTVPLVILLGLTVASRHQAWPAIVGIIVGNGILLWLFGRSAYHIGASGLVFGLIAYLITVGIREKQIVSVGVALLVGFLFGGTLLFGVIPDFSSADSWDGHLCGAVAGVLVGTISARTPDF